MARHPWYDKSLQTEIFEPPREMYDLAERRTRGMRHRLALDERISLITAMASAYVQGVRDAVTSYEKIGNRDHE